MSDSAEPSLVLGARAYEDLFVPAVFRAWAVRVADAARLARGERVLDVACGTGVLAREAAARVGDARLVAGVDPNPGMLAVARQAAPDVDWREAAAESLPHPGDSFDAVVSQFGMMFFSDRRAAVREMLRVAKPGGRIAVAVWDVLSASPGWAAEVAVVERGAGRAAADALRAPFVLGDRNAAASLFAEAGLAEVSVATSAATARFPSVRAMVEADLRGWLPIVGIDLPEERIVRTLEEAERELRSFVVADGRVEFPASAHVVTGRKPPA
jgi:SAM-dependent methyltransferase